MNTLPLLPDLKDYKLPKTLPTLVVDMEVLFKDIHYSHGWKLFKRQRLDDLLKFASNHFELIIWSSEKFPLGQTMILGCGISCMGVLHQNNLSYCGGKYYKDLRRLGRDIHRVVRVTTSTQNILADQEDNTIVLDGSRDDCLDGLTNYLKTLSLAKGDLRPKIRECNRQDCIDKYKTRDVTGFLSRLIGLAG
ncbi:NLI interacting factor-like phosphatase [Gregarina niphandrodes]|uniref:Mitochondrial import inner membrane translocase subunit TIM50 n=1 Tax=Gregarina niphandrodes TaxID=110365 RepID=A0A023B0S0_GRENI|nr:NLI interacting factor-like phosphatase [Gregarina niphandrodes]EZG45862.1 NLI interacting factor-like phosphatase [Gregarina niphandrodes]|eukprot:XP_011132434.1 NLI interacting factor-like phosphatase [Gregarina niphandrodes]